MAQQHIARALTVNERVFGMPSAWVWRAGAPMLRPPGLSLTNALYHALSIPAARRRQIVAFPDFYFLYNRISGLDEAYRPHGFAEVQAWFPPGTRVETYREILDILVHDRARPIFTAMKGHTGDPFLQSVPGSGQSFTVGVPKPGGDRVRFRATLSKIFEHVIAAGGRVNLSKDEFLSADQFRRMYKGAEVFRRLKQRLDPAARFQSDQYRRLFGET
jgi:decaprenylphospho-beta-D-ribofuranose 2-oxidase